MSISIDDISDYLNLTFPELSQDDLDLRVKNFKKRIVEKTINLDDYFLIRDEAESPVVASWIFSIEAQKYAFQAPRLRKENKKALVHLFLEVKKRFDILKGRELQCRTIHDMNHEFLNKEMTEFGFQLTGNRVEYKTIIEDLDFASHGDSPLEWRTELESDSWSLEKVALFMEQVAQNDPDYNSETESAKECLESYLSEEDLYREKDCIQIGYLRGEDAPCCFILAQVEPASGWSRITYMGIHPDFRGRGLGVWVQRHGVEMLKKQGGIEYHGGTNKKNNAMLSIFDKNGCKIFRELSEWKL